jgi:hypothetical protein
MELEFSYGCLLKGPPYLALRLTYERSVMGRPRAQLGVRFKVTSRPGGSSFPIQGQSSLKQAMSWAQQTLEMSSWGGQLFLHCCLRKLVSI